LITTGSKFTTDAGNVSSRSSSKEGSFSAILISLMSKIVEQCDVKQFCQ
jgi:hypothetical protein